MGHTGIYACGESVSRRNSLESVALFSLKQEAPASIGGSTFTKHAGVISYFQKEYIKTGIFDKMYSKYLSQAFQIRNNTDYADFFIVSQLEAKEQYDKALDFCHAVEIYLVKRISQ